MQPKSTSEAYKILSEGLGKSAYLSHKESRDAINRAKASMPRTIYEYIALVRKPKLLVSAVKLDKLARNFEFKRADHNNVFVKNEAIKRKDFFGNIGGKSLDHQQIAAVIPDEDNTLIIAGAGSGKTLTIEAKVKYLINCLNVSADAILPISFTKKSATTMKERINIPGINPMTFHGFGFGALRDVEHRSPTVYDGTTKNDALFRSFIKDLSLDTSYLANLTNFFLNFIKIPKSDFDFESLGDYIQYLKDQNFTTYKKISFPYQGKLTYKNEVVKSIQECVIGNFLLFNNIDYEYEAQYQFPLSHFEKKTKYEPDFTITVNGQKIFLEHFGIDRDNNVPPFFAGPNETYEQARQKYISSINWKRQTHTSNGTKLIETYSYEFLEDGFLKKLADRLRKAGVPLAPMNDDEIWGIIQESGKDEVDAFISLTTTFLSLMKSNHYEIEELRERNRSINPNKFLKERTEQFLLLFEPLYGLYENYLNETGQIDFNDMTTRATAYIANNSYRCPLEYVIIDEFQDLSVGRYKMLEAIRIQNPAVKFYCVGDDWQSIYRFAGSDIALFRDFEKYFGYTYKQKIETTYRFNQPLIDVSSDFILKNPNQTIKHLKAPENKAPTNYSIIESPNFDGDDTESLIDAIHELITLRGYIPGDDIYLIGRYTFDIQRIKNWNNEFKINQQDNTLDYTIPGGEHEGKNVHIEFFTAHKSKGLEASYTIVINCNSGKMGFPSEKADDPLLNLLLSSADQYENGEERRLFYVAITRTKKHVVLLADKSRKSKFIKELQNERGDHRLRCPKCKEGDLIERVSHGRTFYGCSNFSYGCDHSQPSLI